MPVSNNYEKTDNLKSRINLHQKYGSKNPYNNGWFDKYFFYERYNVLEIGCGTGAIWEWDDHIDKLPKGVTLTLTDLSAAMVKEVGEKFVGYPNVSSRVMNVQAIDYEDNTFDVIIANSMLYHTSDLNEAISEIYRVLKPKGFLYASTFGRGGQLRYFNRKLKEFNAEFNAFEDTSYSFVLQNGKEILKRKFENVILYEFSDYLDVTDSSDIVRYILSTAYFADISKDKVDGLEVFFDKQKDADGFIKIPRQYGTFIAQK